jgi:hypothetical protein
MIDQIGDPVEMVRIVVGKHNLGFLIHVLLHVLNDTLGVFLASAIINDELIAVIYQDAVAVVFAVVVVILRAEENDFHRTLLYQKDLQARLP